MEESLKRQIVDAAEAVKVKVRKMRDAETNNKQALESVFKPVTEPLNLIANANKQTPLLQVNDNFANFPFIKKTLETERTDSAESNDNNGDEDEKYESDVNSDSSYESVVESYRDCDTSSWSVSSEALVDIPFGVRAERGKLMLGSASITINDQFITVAGHKYRNTPGLKQLLLKKDVNLNLVTDSDMQNYKSMLLDTNAHRRDYEPSKPIKSNKGQKYLQVIKPLFKLKNAVHGKGLPLLKKWRKNVDLVYWDDPNELVERLKLLIASRDAGNTGLDNEIISIIEELRESKIINK